MELKQLVVLATAVLMIVAVRKIGLTQLAELLQRLGRGGGSPPNHPLPGDDSVILLRRRKRST